MATDYDTVIKLRLISFTVDYNDTSKIEVTFSDAIRVHDIYEDASSIQAQANSAAMSFQFNKDQYDKSVNQSNFVAEMRKYGLDVATTQIHNSKNQSQVWDETGMTFRMWNNERNDFDPEQIKIINNMMVFSDDGFQTSKMAIGKIPIDKNGNYAYGINAEVLMSKLVMSENLWIENNSGNYKFNDSGFTATNGNNTIKIQPNQSGELFSIYKGNNKQVYINSDGDVEFAGSLKSASGKFSGLISGGEININNTFTVDKDGNMYASSARISGEVNASSGTIGGWNINNDSLSNSDNSVFLSSDGTISGATITGANGEFTEGFKVDLSDEYNFYQKLNFADKGFYVSITTTDTGKPKVSSVEMKPDGTIWISANGGNHIDNGGGKIILDGTPFTKNEQDRRVRLARVDQIPSRTTDIAVSYRGTGSDIINFSGVTNDDANYAAATPRWVKNHLTNNIKTYADSYYAPKEHSHPKYTTESEVGSIVRSMVKSKYLN